MLNKFQHDYLVFDDAGLERVLCMACATPIRSRRAVKVAPGETVPMVAPHPNYRELPVMFTDGTISFLMVCEDCRNTNPEDHANDISRQLDRALRMQFKHEGKPDDVIESFIEKGSRTVLRRAETNEVVHALRGV